MFNISKRKQKKPKQSSSKNEKRHKQLIKDVVCSTLVGAVIVTILTLSIIYNIC